MPSDDTDAHDPIFHYENGVPVFNTQRLNALEQEQEQAKKRDKEYKDEQLSVNRRVMIFTGVLALCSIAGGGISIWQAHIANVTAIAAKGNATSAAGTVEEMKKSGTDTHNLAQAAADQADALKKSNALLIAANRPWIGQTEGLPIDVMFLPNQAGGMQIEYLWRIRNSGHRPAQLTKIETTGTLLSECTMKPDYSQPSDAAVPEGKSTSSRASSHAMLLPGGGSVSRYREYIPHQKWRNVIGGTTQYCIYISLTYRDIDYPQVLHHTTDCEVLMPQVPSFAGCVINYGHAD